MAYKCDECGYKHITDSKPDQCADCGNPRFTKIEHNSDKPLDESPMSLRYQTVKLFEYSLSSTISFIKNAKDVPLLYLGILLIVFITIIGLIQLLFLI